MKPKLLEIQSRLSISKALTILSAMWREFSSSSAYTAYSTNDELADDEAEAGSRPSARGPASSVDILTEKQSRSKLYSFSLSLKYSFLTKVGIN